MESLGHHWGFLDDSLDPRLALAGTYDSMLVVLSVVIASLAAYAVLGLAERISAADKPLAKRSWLAAGGGAGGTRGWGGAFLRMAGGCLPGPGPPAAPLPPGCGPPAPPPRPH